MCAYPGVGYFELSQDILGHVILGHGVHHKVLVSSRPLCWPVLVAFFLSGVKNRSVMSHNIRFLHWLHCVHSHNCFYFQFMSYLLLLPVCSASRTKEVYAYPAHFSQLGEHDNNSGVVLPEHSPEVLCGLCQWSLCGNIGFLLPVGMH